MEQEEIIFKQILKTTPIELQYVKRSILMREVNTRKLWTLELRTAERMNAPSWIIVGVQQRDRQNSKELNFDTFYRPPVTSAQCLTGTEKHPGSAILVKYHDDEYSPGYCQIEEVFRALTKDDIFKPFLSDHYFRSTNVNDAGEDDNAVWL